MARRQRKCGVSSCMLLISTLLQVFYQYKGASVILVDAHRSPVRKINTGLSPISSSAATEAATATVSELYPAHQCVVTAAGKGIGVIRYNACGWKHGSKCLGRMSSANRIAALLRGGQSSRCAVADGTLQDREGEEMKVKVEAEGAPGDEGVEYDEKAVEWMMQQLCMYQTRTALISGPLAVKGYKVKKIVPSPRGLVCALSTEERRMDCRMYVEAEVGKKVVAPCKCKGTQKWISLSALNSERRKEVAKWKQCPVCQARIDYKLYETHGGEVGKTVSAVLNNVRATRTAIGVLVGAMLWIMSPLLHAVVVRVLTSAILWKNYHRVQPLMHLGLPMQLMTIRLLMNYSYAKLLVLENMVRQWLTDIESNILEKRLPVTVQVDDNGEEVPVVNPWP